MADMKVDSVNGAEIMEKYEKESRTRKFASRPLNLAVYVNALAMTL